MTNRTVCIEREYGSNGKKIAEWLSKSTGIHCYGKNELLEAAEKYGLVQENGEDAEENEYKTYCETIKFLADKGSCIFVGTCASAVLQGRPRNFNVFIKADMDSKIFWAMESEKVDRDKAEEIIAQMDDKRKETRKHFAVTADGKPVEYDLVVTSSKFGIEGTAEIIKNCLSRI